MPFTSTWLFCRFLEGSMLLITSVFYPCLLFCSTCEMIISVSTCEALVSVPSECTLHVNVFFLCSVNVFSVWRSSFCVQWMFPTYERLISVFREGFLYVKVLFLCSECFLHVNILFLCLVNVFYMWTPFFVMFIFSRADLYIHDSIYTISVHNILFCNNVWKIKVSILSYTYISILTIRCRLQI